MNAVMGANRIQMEERESRLRLGQVLLQIEEQVARRALGLLFNHFVTFYIKRETVWRRAARELLVRHAELMNNTECVYQRFQIEVTAVSEKYVLFQEFADYLVSLRTIASEYHRRRGVTPQRIRVFGTIREKSRRKRIDWKTRDENRPAVPPSEGRRQDGMPRLPLLTSTHKVAPRRRRRQVQTGN